MERRPNRGRVIDGWQPKCRRRRKLTVAVEVDKRADGLLFAFNLTISTWSWAMLTKWMEGELPQMKYRYCTEKQRGGNHSVAGHFVAVRKEKVTVWKFKLELKITWSSEGMGRMELRGETWRRYSQSSSGFFVLIKEKLVVHFLNNQANTYVPLLFVKLINKRWSSLVTFTNVTTTPHFEVKNVRFCMLHWTCPLFVSASCVISQWGGCDVNSDKGLAAGVSQERAGMTYGLLATLFHLSAVCRCLF